MVLSRRTDVSHAGRTHLGRRNSGERPLTATIRRTNNKLDTYKAAAGVALSFALHAGCGASDDAEASASSVLASSVLADGAISDDEAADVADEAAETAE